MTAGLRHLVVVLGDQLDRRSAAFDGFDASRDAVWMAEVAQESTHVPVSRQRIAIFLAAMRHFAQALREAGIALHYRRLDDPANRGTLQAELAAGIAALAPQRVVMVEPGEWRVREALREAVASTGCHLEEREDRHFLCSTSEFAAHARGRRQLRMETFYREMRRRHGVLMEGAKGDEPAGGAWNFDAENRESFGSDGPGFVPPPARFSPDEITLEVIRVVNAGLPGAPGSLDDFGWPVTREQALQALEVFVEERLEHFGRWQDAMWSGQPWLYHAHLSAALNLRLLDPREVIARAEAAWREGRVPLASAEGFIRQVLGWREYVRGIYWLQMPGYADMNALDAHEPLPAWYWNGATDMECLREAIGQTLRLGYAHHIQRLMVTGLYALLLGVEPRQVHEWYLSVYVDAVEWVELPNTLGMGQFADGGLMASKPYAATGKYIERMSDHCRHCRYRPERRTGSDACPFTTLYWDFLLRHEQRFAKHPRMALQVKNVARIDEAERRAIGERAAAIRRGEVGAS
jgi:deoxyribodipyrimidine photolyase-related protein